MRNPYMNRKPSVAEILVGMAGEAWRRSRERRELVQFMQRYPVEASHLARDLSIEFSELVRLCGRGTEWQTLLTSRLQASGIGIDVLNRTEPEVARDLARCCAQCGSKARCARDLKRQPKSEDWRTYCANEQTLDALRQNQRPER